MTQKKPIIYNKNTKNKEEISNLFSNEEIDGKKICLGEIVICNDPNNAFIAFVDDTPEHKIHFLEENSKGEKGDKGDIGPAGPQGLKGDKGDTGATGSPGPQGPKGDVGDPFSIFKTYPKVEDMEADATNVPQGKFVIISNDDMEDPNNAKLYVKSENSFNYITDLSGAQGIKGDKGDPGSPGANGQNGSNGKDGFTPEIGENGNWFINSSDTGKPSRGDKGNDGTPGTDGITPQFKIVDGYWEVSYDNGNQWTRLGKAIGENGQNGTDGTNGLTPEIGTDGYWYIGEQSTGVIAKGQDGSQGADGANGVDGISCTHSWQGTTLCIESASGSSCSDLKGPKGDSITSITTSTDTSSPKIHTVTIEGTGGIGAEFTVTDGQDGTPGKNGITPHIGLNGNWFIGEEDTQHPSRGSQGYYFTPKVDSNGDISWTNNGGLVDPKTVNIKGPQGYSVNKITEKTTLAEGIQYNMFNSGNDITPIGTFIAPKGPKGDSITSITIGPDAPDSKEHTVTITGEGTIGTNKFTVYDGKDMTFSSMKLEPVSPTPEGVVTGITKDVNTLNITYDTTTYQKKVDAVGKIDATPGASRHGEVFNDYVNNKAIGTFSHAEGCCTLAKGGGSHAEGEFRDRDDCGAYGENSHTEGIDTSAKGHASHAEGGWTTSIGIYSHAEGGSTTASGKYSHAEGEYTTATGDSSHAEGRGENKEPTVKNAQLLIQYNTVTNEYYIGIVDGGFGTDTRFLELRNPNNSLIGRVPIINFSSWEAIAFKDFTAPTESISNYPGPINSEEYKIWVEMLKKFQLFPINYKDWSSNFKGKPKPLKLIKSPKGSSVGLSSHSEGNLCVAFEDGSHAGGKDSWAGGKNSLAFGDSVMAVEDNQIVFGKYNIQTRNAAFIIGNGTGEGGRNNMFTVDKTGNTKIEGNLECNSITSPTGQFAGLRPKIKFMNGGSCTLTELDHTVIIYDTANITLPENPQDGQEYFIIQLKDAGINVKGNGKYLYNSGTKAQALELGHLASSKTAHFIHLVYSEALGKATGKTPGQWLWTGTVTS